MAYKNCFTPASGDNTAEYRPLFYWTDEDKLSYDQAFHVVHSRCYTHYGLKRTGCAGCPFSSKFAVELEIIKAHEPKLYKAVMSIFGPAYEYYHGYQEFKRKDR